MKKLLLLLLIAIFVHGFVQADEKTWTGAVNNDWNDPGNWQNNSLPTADDAVIIPAGTPTCELPPNKSIKCETFTNNGNILCENSTLQTYFFDNSGTVNINSGFNVTDNGIIGVNVANTGVIQGDDNSKFSVFVSTPGATDNEIENVGTIATSTVNFQVDEFNNWTGSTVTGDVFIGCKGGVMNAGEIQGSENSNGGNIVIISNTLTNLGTIEGGNASQSGSGSGGSLLIVNNQFSNTGTLKGGNGGENSGEGGEVTLFGSHLDFIGTLEAGYSNGGWSKSEPEAADIYINGDTILIHPGDNLISAGMMNITGNLIEFYDINNFAGIIGENGIEINTSVAGSADFSGVDTEGALYSVSGDIVIQSDNITAPSSGMNHIADPDPEQNPANPNIIGGSMGSGYQAYGGVLSSGIIVVTVQNQSSSAKAMDYSCASQLGWVSTNFGTTALLEPFEMTNFEITFDIPGNINEETIDNVSMTLSIDGTQVDVAIANITCIPGMIVGFDENHVNIANDILKIHPNPFYQSITISNTNTGETKIYDLGGNLITTLNGNSWNGADLNGNQVHSGSYILKAEGYKPTIAVKLK
jgi:type IX secretion system substrate protein